MALYRSFLIKCLLVSLILLLGASLVDFSNIRFGFITGKELYASFIGAAILPILGLYMLINSSEIKINAIDILVVTYLAYIILSSLILNEFPDIIKMISLGTVALCYFVTKILVQVHKLEILILSILIVVVFQGLISLMQLYGFIPSHHPMFRITGQFSNPALLACFFVSIIPFIVQRYRFTANKIGILERITIHTIPIALILMISVLPATQSRASWIACLCSLFFIFSKEIGHYLKVYILKTGYHKLFLTGLIVTSFILLTYLLYEWKPDSVNGRILVWKITLNLIADNPLIGIGYGAYSPHFAKYQTQYFKAHSNNEEMAMVAGSGEYAFNELLHILAEEGAIGLILFGILISCSFLPHFSKSCTKPGKDITYSLIKGAKGSIIAILIFSLFSYPFSSIPILLLLFFYFGVISSSLNSSVVINSPEKFKYPISGLIVVATVVISSLIISWIIPIYKASKSWALASYHSSMEEYSRAALIMNNLTSHLMTNGRFMFEYGQILYQERRYVEAIKVLQSASTLVSDLYLYTTLGRCYQKLGDYEKAEEWFNYSINFIPHRFYPRYLLFKLYVSTSQIEKAYEVYGQIINMKVKVPSLAVNQMKQETLDIMNRIEQSKK